MSALKRDDARRRQYHFLRSSAKLLIQLVKLVRHLTWLHEVTMCQVAVLQPFSAADQFGALFERTINEFKISVEFLLVHDRAHFDARSQFRSQLPALPIHSPPRKSHAYA